ncbi:MAG: xanthine dehydrogenase [Acidobacteria bacterium]|nr:MAG: xanthine dehydrogenase [Acidobacteriota bacterium]
MFLRPTTLREATQALAEGGQVLAGGTDFFPALGSRTVSGAVIDVSRVGELRGIEFSPDEVRIGGATTWSEIAAASLPRCFDALRAAAREVGAVQVQNRGTIAGNLCNASPAADSVPPLLILDAEVELTSCSGVRRLLLRDFIVGNRKTRRRSDEILSSVIVPLGLQDVPSVFLKLGARRYLVISITMLAALLSREGDGRVGVARIAVGSCSATAQRLLELERDLAGQPVRRELSSLVRASHIAPLSPIDDVRAPAAYRRDVTLTLVRRALDACVEAQS